MTELSARFVIPKARIKTANMAMGHIVAAQKSAWLREYAFGVWTTAAMEQFGLVAEEPGEDELDVFELSPRALDLQQNLSALEGELAAAQDGLAALAGRKTEISSLKKELRALLKSRNDIGRIEFVQGEIHDYDLAVLEGKMSVRKLRTAKAAAARRAKGDITKELRRIESARKKDIVKKRLAKNADRQLFSRCAVVVTVNNITAREYDSPNFSPTLKPILDAATDTGIIWPDDNNDIIAGGVLFLPGTNLDRDNYILDVKIMSEWPWAGEYC